MGRNVQREGAAGFGGSCIKNPVDRCSGSTGLLLLLVVGSFKKF